LNVDPYNMHSIWANFLGFVLLFASLVFIIVLQEDEDGGVADYR
jgi:hypothetical protein